uniref:cobaltochelatase CobT-related protein n=1 Tax=uncultured Halomonas sp. TaxID=173971 RepID=UPI002608AEC3|nr:hypothetical protein [uncultured Halomonas sp.]
MLTHSTDSVAPQPQALANTWERIYAAGREKSSCLPSFVSHEASTRAEADTLAAWRRWHAPLQQQRFNPNQRPWFDVLERARVETLASSELSGMASNLRKTDVDGYEECVKNALYAIARQVFAGEPATRMALPRPRSSFDKNAWPTRVLRSLFKGKQHDSIADSHDDISEHQLKEALEAAARHLHDSQAFTDSLINLIAALSRVYTVTLPVPSETQLVSATANAENETELEDDSADEEHNASANHGLPEELAERDDAHQGYKVFSRQWDQTHSASYWATQEDTIALRQLDTFDRRRVRQLAHRLQRKLIAARQRYWDFDQEEGRLDSRRLARLVGDHPTQRVFRQEQTPPLPDACVTLLVDQSGSMSGRRRHMAALAIDLAAHTLETCRIGCEVLGFTTRYTADSPLAKQWRHRGANGQPGRLNAIRHVIYKAAEQPWRRVRPQLGYLLRELPGHENIDGEALHWAAMRLSRRPEPHKVLIVLSDGAPYDKATAQANGRDFLERHLRHIVAELERSPIHLAAIGTGQDVARFYQHVLTVRHPDEVADKLFEQLSDLLTPGLALRRVS